MSGSDKQRITTVLSLSCRSGKAETRKKGYVEERSKSAQKSLQKVFDVFKKVFKTFYVMLNATRAAPAVAALVSIRTQNLLTNDLPTNYLQITSKLFGKRELFLITV